LTLHFVRVLLVLLIDRHDFLGNDMLNVLGGVLQKWYLPF